MHREQYTPDTICRSMGMPSFIESGWRPPTLRLLLKPSFDPELCITLASSIGGAALSVAALTERLWCQPGPCQLMTLHEHVFVSTSVLDQAVSLFELALEANQELDGRKICLDGMPISACLLSASGLIKFACSPYRPIVSNFVSAMIRDSREQCRNPRVRNALAACGRYVGLEISQEPEPKVPETRRVGILGTVEARAELLRHLDAESGIDQRD